MKAFTCLCIVLACCCSTLAQQTKTAPSAKARPTGKTVAQFSSMPYNRLIRSAGNVVTYGNLQLENHALDLAVLPGNSNIVVEDRYGIAILDPRTRQLRSTWAFTGSDAYKDLMSTYSGITAFRYNNITYIAWGAAKRDADRSFIMIAEWDGTAIKNLTSIPLGAEAPAVTALPNQVAFHLEAGIPYLYVVLNSNNQLLKIRFTDRQTVWTAPTGVAPYGVCIVGTKAYVSNWAGPAVTDTLLEHAGTPWGSAYTNPVTGATRQGSLSVVDIANGKVVNELTLGLHPNAIAASADGRFLYVANANSDLVSVVDVVKESVTDSIQTGLFSKSYAYFGSSPDALMVDAAGTTMYVANGMDNAVAVIRLGSTASLQGTGKTQVKGYIPTEAYPSGIVLLNQSLYITNLEAKGAGVWSEARDIKLPGGRVTSAYSIHKQLASLSVIPIPSQQKLNEYTEEVKELNLFYRMALTNQPPRKNVEPRPLPERTGEPSLFKHVVYIIKENKTYDQVYGDMPQGRGDKDLCIYGDSITPNQHRLSADLALLDNYYASGKSSAEGHQWTDAAMVSDYIEKNVRAWFRSYPHRQTDALVYNKTGFIWNNALDHGKTVRIYGEACTTGYDKKLKWLDIYNRYVNNEPLDLNNTSTIARIRPVLSPRFPDCDNFIFTDQLRARIFIDEWKAFEQLPGDSLPNLLVVSLPNDHSAGTSPNFPVPRAMVADNDLALGRIIETITHSRFWDSTVVFVTEDDSQSGWDHISSYRTTGLVISPYSVLKKTISTSYNQTSMVRTIEQILGIPPMNVIDATALPMFDCFTNVKTPYRYDHIPAKVALTEMNKPLSRLKGKALYYARLSANSVFKELDGGEDDQMNRILWFDAKGEKPYPAKGKSVVSVQ